MCKRKNAYILVKEIADIDYRNSKDTWKQIGTIFNLKKRKTEKVETDLTGQGVGTPDHVKSTGISKRSARYTLRDKGDSIS